MAQQKTDFSRTLEELTSLKEGDPEEAPTQMVWAIQRAWKKPLIELSDEEVGQLVVQQYGYPYLLDLLWPKLNANPLFDGGYYPGDVLSNLIRADVDIWVERPDYKTELDALYRRALHRPNDESDAFLESLQLPKSSATH